MFFFSETTVKMKHGSRGAALAVAALALAACAAPVDDTIGSRLAQRQTGTVPQKPAEGGDVAIVGQEFAHSIMALPQVAEATTPLLVQFTGVTSIVVGKVPVDTDPYTDLLRDRLLLLTREKLRFVEHTLPQLVIAPKKKSKSKKEATPAADVSADADYQVLADMPGNADDEDYEIQVEWLDARPGHGLISVL